MRDFKMFADAGKVMHLFYPESGEFEIVNVSKQLDEPAFELRHHGKTIFACHTKSEARNLLEDLVKAVNQVEAKKCKLEQELMSRFGLTFYPVELTKN
ncbi:hypothetical protein [Rheinheimera sp. EpRS3]|uniref:hypothetical protein n=1 Tax=Rheinheimera sp. EpRS3 TaxID=1712383 RepID=UPI00074789D1|nr:hypothetical protein [Rheinheimera sp. EpRS3]KUM53894.1 hypothetical protein AR688_19780 [Rheinheimera sp. EpRS3]